MLETKSPAMNGIYNGISFGLFKFLWMYRTIEELQRFGKSNGVDVKLGHAKPILFFYIIIAPAIPLITSYLLTTEVVPPNGGDHYYGLISPEITWWLLKVWQIPAIILVLSLVAGLQRVLPQEMRSKVNWGLLYFYGVGGALIGWLTMLFVDSSFLFELLLMSLFVFQFQKEKIQVVGVPR